MSHPPSGNPLPNLRVNPGGAVPQIPHPQGGHGSTVTIASFTVSSGRRFGSGSCSLSRGGAGNFSISNKKL
eukprot:4034157-Amphidinium_carterae.2